MSQERDWIEEWWETTPEPKLELIDGQLFISTLEGSRRIFWECLRDYGPPKLLSHAPAALWWEALQQAFQPEPMPRAPEEWLAWADALVYNPEPGPAGPRGSVEHRRIYDQFWFGLFGFMEASGLGRSIGRDFVVRLGENGLTPDQVVMDRSSMERLREYFLDGPPAIVVEIADGRSAEQDRTVKRRLYEAGGIPEYWMFDAQAEEALFLRLDADGRYHPEAPDSAGIYRSSAVPGLALSLPHLWSREERRGRSLSFLPFLPPETNDESPLPYRKREPDEPSWDSVPFAPRTDLQPVPIRFDEFISWSPEAKFERSESGIEIGGTEGSARVAGLLLMTFGLVEAVRLAHPREWVMFLDRDRHAADVERLAEPLLAQAGYKRFETRPEDEYHSARVPGMPEVHVYGETRAECQNALEVELRDRILLRLARHKPIPDEAPESG